MTNTEIFKKVIKKAIKNGWDMFGLLKLPLAKWEIELNKQDFIFDREIVTVTFAKQEDRIIQASREVYESEILISKEFAKALWGVKEELAMPNGRKEKNLNFIPAWQFYRQKMLLEDKPIKYLEKFI